MKFLEIKAPAKINIGLNIISKRVDGFHNLETIFYPLYDLCDIIQIKKSEEFKFSCDNSSLLCDESNLAVRAIKLLEDHTKKKFNVDIFLQKTIPMGAGLGGGSSDAAAILIGINEMFTLELDQTTMLNLALELGSDVPFFLKSKPSFGKSRGEVLTEVALEIRNPILVVNPGIHISTKEAFSNITPMEVNFNLEKSLASLKEMSDDIKVLHKNDFEQYAFTKFGILEEIKNKLYESGALLAQMSGSGSTMYGIFKSLPDAISAKSQFPKEYFKFISFPQEYPTISF